MDELIARVIDHIYDNWQAQPGLGELARVAGLAPHHFQKRFKARCGLSPKRFVQALTLDHARRALDDGASVLDAAFDVGLSGPSRLHDLFLAAEAVTPGSFKAKGGGLALRIGRHESPFGAVTVAMSEHGLAWLGFAGGADPRDAVAVDYPLARLGRDDEGTAAAARAAFAWAAGGGAPMRLDLRGTGFQLQVWRALLELPPGETVSYGAVAERIGARAAVRAVANAVGGNRVALVIPCHRVIREGGALGGYRWGCAQKRRLLAAEGRFTADEAA